MSKRVGFTAILFLAAIFAVVLFRDFRTSSPSSVPATSAAVDHSRWMETHIEQLGARTLSQLVLPASHDSAMYLNGFPQSLARTQDLNLYGQLTAGVRYFDLRPQFHNGTLWMFHGPVAGPKVSEVLGDIHRFMSEGHRELVILKFSHYDGFSAAAYATLLQQINRDLAPWLFTTLQKGKRLTDVTLGEYLKDHGTILVVCDGHYPIAQACPGIWVYRDWDSPNPEHGDLRVFDQYSNTMSFATMMSDQFGKFDQFTGACRDHPQVGCDLFLLSWTITPPTNVPAFAVEPNKQLAASLDKLHQPNSSGRIVNLLYADCVNAALTDVAIRENLRR